MDNAMQRNIESFRAERSSLLSTHAGEWVLYYDGRRIGLFKSESEAFHCGLNRFGVKPMLIQPVREEEPLIQYTTLGMQTHDA